MRQIIKSNVVRRGAVLLVAALLACGSLAQSVKFFPAGETFSNSSIYTIHQDSVGYVWIGTNDGLNRYDGYHVNVYRHDAGNERSLIYNKVLCVNSDAKGHLLVGTRKMGLQRYNYDTDDFTTIPIAEGNTGVVQIYTAPDGRTYVVTVRYGIRLLAWDKAGNPSLEKINLLPPGLRAENLAGAENGALWFVASDHRIYRSHRGNKAVKVAIAEDDGTVYFTCLFIDSRGVVYAGTQKHGLYMYDAVTQRMRRLSAGISSLISGIEQMDGTHLYVATDGEGMKCVDVMTGTVMPCFTNISSIDMSHDKVAVISQNHNGDLWVGAYRRGVYFFPRQTYGFGQIIPRFVSRHTEECYVTALTSDGRSGSWMSVEENGIYHFDSKGEQTRMFPLSKSSSGIPSDVMALLTASDGRLWVGAYLGEAGWIDTASGAFTPLSHIAKGAVKDFTHVNGIYEAPDRDIWFCTNGHGLIRYNPSTNFVRQYTIDFSSSDKNRMHNNFLSCIYIDKLGRVFYGTGSGIGCLDSRTGSYLSAFGKDHIFHDVSINCIMMDGKGNLWAGSDEGLCHYDMRSRKETRYTTANGLPSDCVCGLEIDDDSNVWVSTLMGLARMDTRSNTFHCYYASDGLQANEFSATSCASTDGKFYFGGINGATFFNPYNIGRVELSFEVVPSELTVANIPVNTLTESDGRQIIDRPINEIETIRLSYKDASFSIGFTTFSYVGTMGITYYYSIDGSEWVALRRGEHHVSFSSLAPGHHELKVKARIGEQESEERTISIIVSPPWYETWWAMLIYAAIIGIVAWLLYRRWSERQANKFNDMRMRFFIDLSHDIRTPLTMIISPLDSLMRDTTLGADVLKNLQTMYRNANRILTLVNQMLDIRKIDKGHMRLSCTNTDVVHFIENIFRLYAGQAKLQNIDFSFHHDMSELYAWIDSKAMTKVMDNLLSNAFKFTPNGGSVVITLTLGEDSRADGGLRNYFEISVTDTGVGLDGSEKKHIFERFYRSRYAEEAGGTGIGLNLCSSLIDRHHGIISAENRQDGIKGSRFFFRLPLGRAYLSEEEISQEPVESGGMADDDAAIADADSAGCNATKKSSERKKNTVLVVDDDAEIVAYLSEELSRHHKVITAGDGREGLRMALTRNPDIILCDVMMPDVDGLSFLKTLKHNQNISHIPVIMLTAKSGIQDRVDGLSLGADAYISKPFHIEEVEMQISNLIANRQRLRGKYSGMQEQKESVETVEMDNADEKLMERVMEVINKNMNNADLSMDQLAQEVGLSRTHLHRKIKELTGVSPGDFVRSIRLREAARLLKERQGFVSQIAYSTGFNSPSVFSSAFKKAYGLSPSEYIENNKKQ